MSKDKKDSLESLLDFGFRALVKISPVLIPVLETIDKVTGLEENAKRASQEQVKFINNDNSKIFYFNEHLVRQVFFRYMKDNKIEGFSFLRVLPEGIEIQTDSMGKILFYPKLITVYADCIVINYNMSFKTTLLNDKKKDDIAKAVLCAIGGFALFTISSGLIGKGLIIKGAFLGAQATLGASNQNSQIFGEGKNHTISANGLLSKLGLDNSISFNLSIIDCYLGISVEALPDDKVYIMKSALTGESAHPFVKHPNLINMPTFALEYLDINTNPLSKTNLRNYMNKP